MSRTHQRAKLALDLKINLIYHDLIQTDDEDLIRLKHSPNIPLFSVRNIRIGGMCRPTDALLSYLQYIGSIEHHARSNCNQLEQKPFTVTTHQTCEAL